MGEKAFTIILFLAGAFFFSQAAELWGRMPQPRISSAAALPLFAGAVWTIFAFLGAVKSIKKPASAEKAEHAPSKEVFVMFAFVVIYCALLFFGVYFYLVTTLFLYGSMCYLSRKGFLKNMLWTGIFMLLTYFIFDVMFGVVFT